MIENVIGVVGVIRKATKREIDEISVDDHLFSLDVRLFYL
jgi:hypothetical protein